MAGETEDCFAAEACGAACDEDDFAGEAGDVGSRVEVEFGHRRWACL